jgi:choline dehydrogenase-like flavoprotein
MHRDSRSYRSAARPPVSGSLTRQIIPRIGSGNIEVAVYMIGEKGAEMINKPH